MSEALAMLDSALEIAQREKAALEDGAWDEAIQLAEERGNIFSLLWSGLSSQDRRECRDKLVELSRLQAQLIELAIEARNRVRDSLNRSRQEKKRIKGYHLAVGQALR